MPWHADFGCYVPTRWQCSLCNKKPVNGATYWWGINYISVAHTFVDYAKKFKGGIICAVVKDSFMFLTLPLSLINIYGIGFAVTHQLRNMENQIGGAAVRLLSFHSGDLDSWVRLQAGCPGHLKYVWVGLYEPCCLQIFPSSVLEGKTQSTNQVGNGKSQGPI